MILSWRLHRERRGGCRARDDRLATRAIAVSFAVLANYVWLLAGRDLLTRAEPETSVVGLLACLPLVVMPWLARAKPRLAPALGSRAAASEAEQTNLCALLSAVVLVGLGLNAALGWWWADPAAAALLIGGIAAGVAMRTRTAESLEDTCCG